MFINAICRIGNMVVGFVGLTQWGGSGVGWGGLDGWPVVGLVGMLEFFGVFEWCLSD